MNNATVYSTERCSACKQVKEYLKEHNIPFDEKIITPENEAILNEALELSGGIRKSPITKINDEVIIGFDKAKFDASINIYLAE